MTSKLAVSSFVLAILSWVFFLIGGMLIMRNIFGGGENPYALLGVIFWLVGFGISILAIVLGIISLVKIKKNKELTGKNYALWGIVLGALPLVFLVNGLVSMLFNSN